MGTDRNEILDIPCLCGQGRITVTFCSPDHAYAKDSQTWREDKIACANCNAKYAIEERDRTLVLVSREDYERAQDARQQKQHELKDLEQRAWENLEKSGELDAAVSYLNTFNTRAAAHRALAKALVYDLRGTFRKRSCTRRWVKDHVDLRALEKLLVEIQTPSQTLDHFFKDYSAVSNRAVPIPSPIGEPILHLSR